MTMIANTNCRTLSPLRWQILLCFTAMILIVGLLTVIALAFGLADPPYAGPVQWQQDQPLGWRSTQSDPRLILDHAPAPLPTVFTLELTAHNLGETDSAWGIGLLGDPPVHILIDNQGYVSTADPPRWAAFRHIQPEEANTLYLHRDLSGQVTLRINEEVAWQWEHIAADHWAILRYREPDLTWSCLKLYGP